MNDFRHGKCVRVGHCAKNCQRFQNDSELMICDFCGHNISEHVIVAVEVLRKGLQILPKENMVSHDALELSERKQLFTKSKVTGDEISKPKVSGLMIE